MYDRVRGISEAEVAALIQEAQALRVDVMQWLRANHPELLPSP